MGDVLVYIDPAINGRLLAFARPLADAAGGALVALVASGEPVDAAALAAADVVLEVTHPALSPYLPEAHQAVLARRDRGALARRRAGREHHGRLRRRRRRGGRAREPALRRLLPRTSRSRAATRSRPARIYGGQLRGHGADAAAGRVRDQLGGAARGAAAPPAPRERASSPRRPSSTRLRTTFIETVEPADEGVDLASADMIVCVGRGIGGAENVELAEELAEALGAELAASRPVIDSGWVPKARQIGKSGATVQPKLYLGLGVSGAPEHVEGMQGAELIIAVNTDPGAAIFNVAHYGAVADLFDVVEADAATRLRPPARGARLHEPRPAARECTAGAGTGSAASSARSISVVSSATSKSAPTTLTASEYIARSFGQETRK